MPSFEENTGAGNFLTNNCGSQQERYRDSSLRRFGKAQGCDERTDGRTNEQTFLRWLRRAKHYMLSRVKKIKNFLSECFPWPRGGSRRAWLLVYNLFECLGGEWRLVLRESRT